MMTLLLIAAMSVPPGDVPAEVDDISASELLKKTEAAYAEVKTYVGTTRVHTKSQHGERTLESNSNAKVTFMRPGKLYIEGRTTSNGAPGHDGYPFTIISDGNKTWHSWPLYNNGAFKEVKNIAWGGMAGVAQRAAEGIPIMLMRSDGGPTGELDPFYVSRLTETKVSGIEKIDGAPCYKMTGEDPSFGHVTLWIDKSYLLLRQMTWEHSEARIATKAKLADEGLKKMGRPRTTPPISSMTNFFSFEIYQVDSRVDEKLFADPTQK